MHTFLSKKYVHSYVHTVPVKSLDTLNGKMCPNLTGTGRDVNHVILCHPVFACVCVNVYLYVYLCVRVYMCVCVCVCTVPVKSLDTWENVSKLLTGTVCASYILI